MRTRALRTAGWALLAALPLAGVLFGGRVLFFRDVCYTYYPDFVFLEHSLRQGVWPLWHPGTEGGTPFLAAYPVHILLVWAVGARATLALSPWLHLTLAMVGAGWLSARLGAGPWGSWLGGAVFGLSGAMLGSLLYPVFLGAAWLPAVVAAFLCLIREPAGWRVAVAASLLALQVTTAGVEVLPQSALAILVLLDRLPGRRALLAGTAALGLAALMAAPAVSGGLWLMRGTARGAGFAPEIGLSYSAALPVLLESLFPGFLGNPHAFGEAGYWGQPFFPGSGPFFLSLYLGGSVVVLALCARVGVRLWILAAAGTLLAAGAHGPLGTIMTPLMTSFRVPAKFFLLATLALALLAAHGLDRSLAGRGHRWAPLVAVPLLAGGLLAWLSPGWLASALAVAIPEAAGPLAREVIATRWPSEWAQAGLLALAAGLAVGLGRRVVVLAGLIALLDLLRAGAPLNPAAEPSFYSLRPEIGRLVAAARAEGPYRWHSYGAAQTPSLRWHPAVAQRDSDVWLYSLERQTLMPRTHVIDGLEAAFDLDRMGLAPARSRISREGASPRSFREQHERLRAANVRWILSFDALPDDLVERRGQVQFPELDRPLSLYALRRALPRAYFARAVPGVDLVEPAVTGARVDYASLDPHTVRVVAETPPGFLVVLDGFHPDWRAETAEGESLPVLQANGGFRAVATAGGRQVVTFRFSPAWVRPALLLALVGFMATVFLAARGVVVHRTRAPAAC